MKRIILLAALAATFDITALGADRLSVPEAADTLVDGHRVLGELEVQGVKSTVRMPAVSLTRVSGELVERLGIETINDIGEIAPNFYMPDYGSCMTSSIYVRGLGSRMDQPVVSLTVDGIPYLNKDAFDFDIFDIAGIEVYRGAQATLGGRNSMLGRIVVNTLSPWHTTGFKALAEYGRFNSWRVGGAWYGRIVNRLASSLSAQYSAGDGAWRNAANQSRVGDHHQTNVRWKLSWRPNTWLSVSNTASLSDAAQQGYPYRALDRPHIEYNDTCSYRRTVFADGLTASFAGKRMIVTSTTSLMYHSDDMHLDQDFLPQDYFTLRQKRHELTFTEDIYAKGSRGAYDWFGGAFVFARNTDMFAPVNFKDTGISRLIESHRNEVNPEYPIEWATRQFTLGSDFDMSNTGFALYHQSTYSVGAWTFDAGLRWDIERASLDYHSYCNTGYDTWHLLPDGRRELYSYTPVDIDDRDHLSQTFNQLLPKLTITWKHSAGRVWLDISKSYKAGGYNTQMFSDVLQQRIMGIMGMSQKYSLDDIVSYKPEKSWNFELGTKYRLEQAALDLSATAYVIDCRDQQLTVFPDGVTTGRIMTNAGRTLSCGLELTAAWQPVRQLSFSGSWGYTHAEFRKFNNGISDFRGKRLPYAPANTLFVTAAWTPGWQWHGVGMQLSADVRCAGNIWFDEANTVRQPFYAVPGVSLALNARHWSLRLWGDNITNTRYSTFYFVSIGNAFVQQSRPWSMGATLRLEIGE